MCPPSSPLGPFGETCERVCTLFDNCRIPLCIHVIPVGLHKGASSSWKRQLASTWKLVLHLGQVKMQQRCKQVNQHVDEREEPTKEMYCLIYEQMEKKIMFYHCLEKEMQILGKAKKKNRKGRDLSLGKFDENKIRSREREKFTKINTSHNYLYRIQTSGKFQ